MSYDEIWNAFDAVAETFTAGGDAVLQGDTYTPVTGRPYFEAKMASYSRRATGPGADCVMEETGSYMISLRRPSEEGRSAGSAIAMSVVSLFSRGLSLTTTDGQIISIMVASPMPAVIAAGWITIPIMISWYSNESGGFVFGVDSFGGGSF